MTSDSVIRETNMTKSTLIIRETNSWPKNTFYSISSQWLDRVIENVLLENVLLVYSAYLVASGS